jgi:hypothetical protein
MSISCRKGTWMERENMNRLFLDDTKSLSDIQKILRGWGPSKGLLSLRKQLVLPRVFPPNPRL